MMIGVPQVIGMKPILTSVFSGLPIGSAANAFSFAIGKMSDIKAVRVAAPSPASNCRRVGPAASRTAVMTVRSSVCFKYCSEEGTSVMSQSFGSTARKHKGVPLAREKDAFVHPCRSSPIRHCCLFQKKKASAILEKNDGRLCPLPYVWSINEASLPCLAHQLILYHARSLLVNHTLW